VLGSQQFDECLLGYIALLEAGAHDAQIAAGAISVAQALQCRTGRLLPGFGVRTGPDPRWCGFGSQEPESAGQESRGCLHRPWAQRGIPPWRDSATARRDRWGVAFSFTRSRLPSPHPDG
jgi:hypothetical protein